MEETSFRIFVTSLNVDFVHVSADTIRREILGMFTDNLIIIKSMLNDVPGHINFAQDLWTASNNDAYISITAHWMDGDWNLVETVLDLKEVRGSHSGENIAESFCESLEEFNLIPKVALQWNVILTHSWNYRKYSVFISLALITSFYTSPPTMPEITENSCNLPKR